MEVSLYSFKFGVVSKLRMKAVLRAYTTSKTREKETKQ